MSGTPKKGTNCTKSSGKLAAAKPVGSCHELKTAKPKPSY